MCGGAANQWVSRTQKASTLSRSEAEYVAMAEGFKEALFLRSVWRFLLLDFGDPCIEVFEGNKGAIQITVNPVSDKLYRRTWISVTTCCHNLSNR